MTIEECMPQVLPVEWVERGRFEDGRTIDGRNVYGLVFRSAWGITVIASMHETWEHDWWLHVSASHAERIPTWRELREIKDLFVGRQRKAIQVLPPESEYVNVHPNVLHLWAPIGRDPLPDFRDERGMI